METCHQRVMFYDKAHAGMEHSHEHQVPWAQQLCLPAMELSPEKEEWPTADYNFALEN